MPEPSPSRTLADLCREWEEARARRDIGRLRKIRGRIKAGLVAHQLNGVRFGETIYSYNGLPFLAPDASLYPIPDEAVADA